MVAAHSRSIGSEQLAAHSRSIGSEQQQDWILSLFSVYLSQVEDGRRCEVETRTRPSFFFERKTRQSCVVGPRSGKAQHLSQPNRACLVGSFAKRILLSEVGSFANEFT
jgi:hypothetical protein